MSDALTTAGRMSPLQSRSGNGRILPDASTPTPTPSTSLSHAHITEAIAGSPDGGTTLDLTHRNLTDVGEDGAELLASKDLEEDENFVQRIALGYNRLATLPMAFALLSKLRYLNLKSNSFSVFPDVLTIMPSLDILDISRNKIKRLPSQPGTLVNLRVFSLSRNKLARLPAYFTDFTRLNILKIDNNPLEWPPRSVMQTSANLEHPEEMKTWITSIQRWMDMSQRQPPKHNDEHIDIEKELDNVLEESFNAWSSFPAYEKDGVTPHVRTFSLDSDMSTTDTDPSRPPSRRSPLDSPLERPPPLSFLSSRSSPTHSPERYLPTPEDSLDSMEDGHGRKAHENGSTIRDREHMRNMSDAVGFRSVKKLVPGKKKSLPDLRTAKLNFGDSSNRPQVPQRTNTGQQHVRTSDDMPTPSPLANRQDSGSSEGQVVTVPRPFARDPITTSPISIEGHRPAPSMDTERNSYFRRLSTLPPANSIPLPPALLSFIDAARGILFAVTQVYQTLQHYTVYAIDDRLSSVLRKVLDPASTYMMQLINNLDHFDSASRRNLPPPSVCRGVIESCKDTVAVYGKAINVLQLQLKVLATHDDVRYLRHMILVLYGAIAEVAYAWQAMLPHIDTIKPLLRERRRPPPLSKQSSTSTSRAGVVPEPLPDTLTFGNGLFSPTITSPGGTQLRSQSTIGRSHTARRHAGSFSIKDVELGKKMPSNDVFPVPTLPLNASSVASRGNSRPPVPAVSLNIASVSRSMQPSPPSSSSLRTTTAPWSLHSRQSSQSSVKEGSAAMPSPPANYTRPGFLETPPSSKTLVDKAALEAMKLAVQAAPVVWEMLDDVLSDVQDVDSRNMLDKAKAVTERFAANILAMQRGDLDADKLALRTDAHIFVKSVVHLSSIVKQYSGTHAMSSKLRASMVKLTNSTEEYIILLHVSSFSPSSTPRPYSPMAPSPLPTPGGQSHGLGPSHLGLPQTDEGRQPVGPLSRSRSAQAYATSRLAAPPQPRSALPSQSFKINPPPRQATVGGGWDDGPG